MYENTRAKQCPKCGWTGAEEARSCARCQYQFPGAADETSLSKVIASIMAGLAATFLVLLLVIVYVIRLLVVSTPAYQEGLRLTLASPELRDALGDRIGTRPWGFGLLLNKFGSQFVEWEVPLAGSRGRGHLYGVANEVNGVWEFSRLVAVPESGGAKVDLAPKPTELSLPAVPAKKVYLVPLDLDAREPLDWAPAYYEAKFGIEVSILPAMHAEKDVEDTRRGQLDAEKCVEYMHRKFPNFWADPSTILIAVTSRDMFIESTRWDYAENYREGSRYAVISSARLNPASVLGKWNPEWRMSRLKKMLTKNIAILYFDLPMSSDYTSLLSGGVLSGMQIDFMSGSIIGAEGKWHSFVGGNGPYVTIYDVPGQGMFWHMNDWSGALPDPSAQVFDAYLQTKLFVQRQTDFRFDGEYPLQFSRVYTTGDEKSRSFGVGTANSLDIVLVGQMGYYVNLIFEDGHQIHFEHSRTAVAGSGDTYDSEEGRYTRAVFAGGMWTISRNDGWKLFMPYRPQALGDKVTVLTGFADPQGHMYRMERDSFGALLSVETPAGQWLHFQNDTEHRIRRIESSTGRAVNYQYDDKGLLWRVHDSDGRDEIYTYDDRAQMLTIAHGSGGTPILTNKYDDLGDLEMQTLADGKKFEYHYVQDTSDPSGRMLPDLITGPDGLVTHIRCGHNSYIQSLPTVPPH